MSRLPSSVSIGGRSVALALVTLVLFSAAGAAAGTVVFDNGDTPSPYVNEEQLSKSAHPVGQAVTTYEANNGTLVELDAAVNDSTENPYTYSPADVEVGDYGAFPHNENVSALDAAEWSTSGASVADTQTGSGVEAVQITTSAAGDSATFSNFSVTSDENKHYGQLGLVVDSLPAGSVTTVEFVDADGDSKQAVIDPSASVMENDSVVANATGVFVWQQQFGQLPTQTASSSDGTFNDLEKIMVTTTSGSVDTSLFAVNAEKTGMWQYGTQQVKNSDDVWEDETVTNTAGPVSISSMNSLGPTFSNATIHNLQYPAQYTSSALSASDTQVSISDAGNTYPAYDKKAVIYTRLSVPSAYDLSHQGLSLRAEQSLPSDRYVAVEVAEGTGDTAFGNISSSAYSDVTGSFSSENETHVLDETIQPGQEIVVRTQLRLTNDDVTAMQQGASGGSTGFFGSSGGGLGGQVLGAIGGAIAAVVALLGNYWRKARSAV